MAALKKVDFPTFGLPIRPIRFILKFLYYSEYYLLDNNTCRASCFNAQNISNETLNRQIFIS